MTNLTELQALGQEFDAGWRNCRKGSCQRHQDCMYFRCLSDVPPPRCAVCKQEICSHTDLSGLSPVDEDEA